MTKEEKKKIADGSVLVLDTETINLNCRLVYNFGWCLLKPDGSITKRSYLIREIIDLPIYENRVFKKPFDIRKPAKENYNESTEIKTFAEVLDVFYNDNADGMIKCYAYNSPFDSAALLYTIEYLNLDLNAMEIKIVEDIIDILPLTKEYFKDKKIKPTRADGRPSYTVENVCRLLYNNKEYIEKHQAVFDSEEELYILKYVTDGKVPTIPSSNYYHRWHKCLEDFVDMLEK